MHMNIWNARQMYLSGLTNHAELITTHIRRSLVRLARGKDEFSPRFAKGAAGDGDEPTLYAASHAWYYLAQISTHLPLEELDLVGRKGGEREAIEATDRWTRWMQAHPDQARMVALHAGQLFRVVRDYPTHGTSACAPSVLLSSLFCVDSNLRVVRTFPRRTVPLHLRPLVIGVSERERERHLREFIPRPRLVI